MPDNSSRFASRLWVTAYRLEELRAGFTADGSWLRAAGCRIALAIAKRLFKA